MPHEPGSWHAAVTLMKFDADQVNWAREKTFFTEPSADELMRLGLVPELDYLEQNLVTTAGLARRATLLIGTGQAMTSTATRIGVGNGAGTAAAGDSDLSAAAGSTNRYFQIMDATYPSASGAVVTLQATFGTADGNFAWNEWCIDIGTPTVAAGTTVAALMLNHKTSAGFGTKSAGQIWALKPTITLS
jgi:hypothetical protein